MRHRPESFEHAQWLESCRERLLSAHPADVVPCGWCGGSGELPHEDNARECDACLGTGRELDPMPVGEAPAEIDATARARASAWGRAA